VLAQYGNIGCEEIAYTLSTKLRSKRTKKAIQCRAARLHISLCKYETCPECGRIVKELIRNHYSDGLCELCYHKSFANPMTRQEIMKRIAKRDKQDEQEIVEAKKARLRERKRRSNENKRNV